MLKSKITKNGMINFPAKLRAKLNLEIGDEVSFLETDDGIIIFPLKSILDATNPDELDIAIKIVEELKIEHRAEADDPR